MIKAILNYNLRHILLLLSLVMFVSTYSQVELAGWNFNGLSSYGTSPLSPTNNLSNLTLVGLTRGSGTNTGGAAIIENNGWGGRGFGNPGDKVTAISANDVFTFTITPVNTLSLSSIGSFSLFSSEYMWFIFTLSQDGPTSAIWQYQVGGGSFIDLGSEMTLTRGNSNALPAIDLSGISNLQNIAAGTTITFRLVAWSAGHNNGGLLLNDPEGDATNDFSVNGITAPTMTTLSAPAAVCSGVSINPTAPTVSSNGAAITSYGWQIETAVGSGSYTNISAPYITASADNGKRIRYYAENSHGINYSNTATLSINASPSISGVTHGTTCGGGSRTVALVAAGVGTLNWYSATTGGSILGTGTNFTTPSIASTTNYYVSATNSCGTTSPRTLVVATRGAPSAPSVTPGSRCGTGTVVLSASTYSGTTTWYSSLTGGTNLGTSASYTTPSISSNTTYYVSATNSCGTSTPRVSVTATINAAPSISAVTNGSRCGTGSVTLGATPSAGTVNWYTASSGGSSAGTGNSYATPSISGTTTYYVDATNGGCTTASRTSVTATINSIPTITGVTHNNRCGNGTVALGATASAGTINWYTTSTLGTSQGTGTSFTTPSLTGTSTYYVDATSGSCTTASRTAVNATINAIPSITSVTDGSRCGVGTINLSATASAGTVNWYSSAVGGTSEGSGDNFTTPSISSSTTYYVDATSGSCTTTSRTAVDAIISGANTTWTGNSDNSWSNPTNWTAGVPCSSSKVIIPDVSLASNYPVITTASYCDSIVFEAGGAVKGLEYLEYNKAFVNMDLQRNRWYTLTTPLKELYSGDYYFEGTPITLMRLFDDIDPDAGEIAVGTWTKTFASLAVGLSTGNGFAFKTDTTEWDRATSTPLKVSRNTDVNFSFPNLNSDGSIRRTIYPYSGLNGKLNSYKPTVLSKDSAYAYRFAMEDASNNLPSSISISVKPGLNLIGNPLMTHLDFNAFQASNSGKISNTIKFWNGTNFDGYLLYEGTTLSTSLSSAPTIIIPPMQAFFVECTTGAASDVDFNVAGHFVADNSTSLRTCSVPRNVMHIQAETPVAKSSICVAKNETANNNFGKDDDYKLFSSITDVPEVYTISSGKALGINQFKSYPYTTPLSIKCAKQGTVKLSFHGVGNFDEEAIVELINSRTGERIDLKENDQYNFEYDGTNGSGELFLSFRTATVTTDITENNNDDIQIYADGNDIHIISSPEDPIQDIDIWNPAGCQLVNKNNINTSSFNTSMSSCSQFYIVKVTSNNKCKTTKVLVK